MKRFLHSPLMVLVTPVRFYFQVSGFVPTPLYEEGWRKAPGCVENQRTLQSLRLETSAH
jgi:hypothetical protein